MLKLNENPPVLWPENTFATELSTPWYVAHTKSRNEKALANDLIRRNINYFLPMIWKIRHQRGRKIRSLLPLFSGYLFFCCRLEKRSSVLKTNRVANIIVVKNQKKLINELAAIEQAIKAGAELRPHKYIKKGQRCSVVSGPLQNLQGIVIKTKNTTRLVLQIDILGQSASLEVDTDLIEPIE